jgi:hypothetical protein
VGDQIAGEAEGTSDGDASAPAVPAASGSEGGRCPRCGGAHTRRQRCPLDLEPEPALPPSPSALLPGASGSLPVAPAVRARPRFEFTTATRADGTVSAPVWRTLRDDAPPVRRGVVRSTARWAGAIVRHDRADRLPLRGGDVRRQSHEGRAGRGDGADRDLRLAGGRDRIRHGADVRVDEDVLEVRLRAALVRADHRRVRDAGVCARAAADELARCRRVPGVQRAALVSAR